MGLGFDANNASNLRNFINFQNLCRAEGRGFGVVHARCSVDVGDSGALLRELREDRCVVGEASTLQLLDWLSLRSLRFELHFGGSHCFEYRDCSDCRSFDFDGGREDYVAFSVLVVDGVLRPQCL